MALLSNAASALLATGRRAGVTLPGPGELLTALRPGRRACTRDGRALIEVRGARRPDAAGLARLTEALEEVPGVRWARLNAPLERVIVGLEAQAPPLAALTAVVGQVEREYQGRPGPDDRAGRPDGSPVDGTAAGRAAFMLAATGAGMAMSVAGAALRVARLPGELGSVATVIDSQPRLRGSLEAVIGLPATDLGLALTSALGQGLAGGGTGLAVDLAHRAGLLGELLAARQAWSAREGELLDGPDRAAASAVAAARPAPLPPGPVEAYADQAALSGLVTFGLTTAATGAVRQAVDLSLATVPKAARLGREGFAGGLGRVLASRGAVVLDAAALRRLDRVDTVVLDAEVLLTGRMVVGEVVSLPEARPEQVAGHLHALFRADDPAAVSRGDGWALGPVDQLPLRGPRGMRDRQRLQRGGATTVLGLVRGQRLMAVVALAEEQVESTDTLAAACHHAKVRLVVAGPPRWASLADAVVPGGARLPDSVRDLQAGGAVVLSFPAPGRARPR